MNKVLRLIFLFSFLIYSCNSYNQINNKVQIITNDKFNCIEGDCYKDKYISHAMCYFKTEHDINCFFVKDSDIEIKNINFECYDSITEKDLSSCIIKYTIPEYSKSYNIITLLLYFISYLFIFLFVIPYFVKYSYFFIGYLISMINHFKYMKYMKDNKNKQEYDEDSEEEYEKIINKIHNEIIDELHKKFHQQKFNKCINELNKKFIENNNNKKSGMFSIFSF